MAQKTNYSTTNISNVDGLLKEISRMNQAFNKQEEQNSSDSLQFNNILERKEMPVLNNSISQTLNGMNDPLQNQSLDFPIPLTMQAQPNSQPPLVSSQIPIQIQQPNIAQVPGYTSQPQIQYPIPMQENNPDPKVQVVRRNFTVAEIIVLIVLSTVLMGGVQTLWNVIPKPVLNIEWKR